MNKNAEEDRQCHLSFPDLLCNACINPKIHTNYHRRRKCASGLLTVALDKGRSVLFTVSAGNSAIQAFDFEGGENKVVSYPQTTVPDKEFELTKDFYWLLKEKNGTALINEIRFSGK